MDSFSFNYFDEFIFRAVPIFIGIIFIIVVSVTVMGIVGNVKQWNKNNNSPVLSVPATLVAKRSDVSHHTHQTGSAHDHHHSSSSTSYFATFEVESGDRIEFGVNSKEYGLLAEQDIGLLTFQGTRFLSFERSKNS